MANGKENPRPDSSRGGGHDFSTAFTFDLQTQKPNKTIDIGNKGISLSLDPYGRILQTSTFHPQHGIIVAVPFEQFDGTKFYDSSYVRHYRKQILQCIEDSRPGFGLDFGVSVGTVSIQIVRANTARFDFTVKESLSVSLLAQISDNGEIQQSATVTNHGSETSTFECALSLCVSINRASYGQLTEGGPIPLPASRNILRKYGTSTVTISNPALGAQLTCLFEICDEPIDASDLAEQETRGSPLNAKLSSIASINPGATTTVQASFRLLPAIECHLFAQIEDSRGAQSSDQSSLWKQAHLLTTYILRRNVDYILENCAIPISQTTTCIIADHVALPLGWNRDNYWQIRLLLETHKHAEIVVDGLIAHPYLSRIHQTVKGHLNWAFHTAQRPKGYWHRSYLVTGIPKDLEIFQLDQQCYPLLEICDYLDYFPDDVDFVKKIADLDVIDTVLQLLESKQDRYTGLWPTDETPGDDAVIYPYHFSSHVLLFCTLSRLQRLYTILRSPTDPTVLRLEILVNNLHERALSAFTVRRSDTGRDVFAYLTDGQGNHTFYHDANDIPTLFALEWGFLSSPADIATWHNTMMFGLSPANKDGYCSEGTYAGLGSVHSPGTWTLGLFQELAYATQTSDEVTMRHAWRKIAAAMQWDGTFSEAIDSHTATCSSKAWFSWPGAMIGALIIRLRASGMEDILLD